MNFPRAADETGRCMLCCQWLTEHHSTGHTTSTLNEKGADIEPSGLDLTLALADNARNQRLPMRPLVAPAVGRTSRQNPNDGHHALILMVEDVAVVDKVSNIRPPEVDPESHAWES
jgi:hypothetical protein